jgi:hypothetical protein
MIETETALRAAIDILRDSIECRRMPSGELLAVEAVILHARAADHLESLLPESQAGPTE